MAPATPRPSPLPSCSIYGPLYDTHTFRLTAIRNLARPTHNSLFSHLTRTSLDRRSGPSGSIAPSTPTTFWFHDEEIVTATASE